MASPLFLSDGSSLVGWNLSSTAIVVDPARGNPAPSIRVPSATYTTRQLTGLSPGHYFEFDVFIPTSSNGLVNAYFMTQSNGAGGLFLRMETRSGFFTYISNSPTGFSSWPGSGTNATISSGSFPANRFAKVRIETRSSPSDQFRLLIDGQIVINWTAFSPGGEFIAFHGDGGVTSGAWFDNIVVGRPARVSGHAKLSSGTPALKVRIRDWVSAVHILETVPLTDGSFSVDVPAGTYEITAIGPSGYQPITHGPVDSVEYTP